MKMARRKLLKTGVMVSPGFSAGSLYAEKPKVQLLSPVVDCAWTCEDDIKTLKDHGVRAVFRYLAERPQPETGLLSKQLSKKELTTLTEHDIAVGTVYQYFSKQTSYNAYHSKNSSTKGKDAGKRFCRVNGERDAKFAIIEAGKLEQPSGSHLYFGVDGSFGPKEMDDVVDYFEGIGSVIGDEFKIGVYGSGLTVRSLLKEAGLVHSNWIAKSPKWWGTQSFYNSGECELFQYAHMVKVPSFKTIKGIDCNLAFEPLSHFGFWGAPLSQEADVENKELASRLRFISGSRFIVREGPSSSAPVNLDIANKKDGVVTARTVKVLGINGDWLKVLFSDEFANPERLITVIGFCESDLLTPDYSKMPVF